MRTFRMVVVLAAVVALVAWVQPAQAKKKKKTDLPGMEGVVTSIDKDAKTFDMKTGKKKNSVKVTVKFDNMTEFVKFDDAGQPEKATRDDLAVNKPVVVVSDSQDSDYATKISIAPPEPK